MCYQPTSIQFHLPDWLSDYLLQYRTTQDINQRMSFVIGAARRNVQERTGGPFAAAIFERDSGRLVSLGVNLVTTVGLSILHAEMVAFALAQAKLGQYDLGSKTLPAHELVTSSEPCAMCFGAVSWSGVRQLICGARDTDATAIGFDEGPKIQQWWSALEGRGISVIRDIQRSEAIAVLKEYQSKGGTIYNSRAQP